MSLNWTVKPWIKNENGVCTYPLPLPTNIHFRILNYRETPRIYTLVLSPMSCSLFFFMINIRALEFRSTSKLPKFHPFSNACVSNFQCHVPFLHLWERYMSSIQLKNEYISTEFKNNADLPLVIKFSVEKYVYLGF